ITRKAFWNLHVPGCDEHYLVHKMRNHPDFCRELAFVAELDGKVTGNIMYTRSKVIADDGTEIDTLTFGPLSVLPEYQRRGIGSALIRHTVDLVDSQRYPAIIIFGNPGNYIKHGFVAGKRLGIGLPGEVYPTAMLVLPLNPEVFAGKKWVFAESDVFHLDQVEAEAFDRLFPAMKKEYRFTQEEFFILSNSIMRN
ncbi:MAG: GNAT family N-acetyltransferase, partial [Candidatus Rifleibacteriota bacterium]